MSRWKKAKKTLAVGLTMVFIVSLLAACGGKDAGGDQDKERVLRIATTMGYGPEDDWFRSQFTEIFEYTHKNIKIEIIPTYDDRFRYGGYDESNPDNKPKDPVITL